MRHSTRWLLGLLLAGAQARAQSADTATDVFKKVADPNHTSAPTTDVFRRAAQAKEAAEANRPDAIATDPNQIEAQVVRRDSIDMLHRAPATPVTPVTPAAAPAPAPAGVPSAIANAFSSAPSADDAAPAPAPAPAPKPQHRVVHPKVAEAPPPAPPKESATVVSSGAAPPLARMGAAPAPPPPKAVFGDTMTTLQREAQNVSQDVAPRYAHQRTSIDSVKSAHNARLDSLEATEGTIADTTERKFEHKMAEAAKIKTDSTRAKTP